MLQIRLKPIHEVHKRQEVLAYFDIQHTLLHDIFQFAEIIMHLIHPQIDKKSGASPDKEYHIFPHCAR